MPHESDDGRLRSLETKLEECLREIRAMRGDSETSSHRPQTCDELLEALGISEQAKQGPPFKWMEAYMLKYGPTRKGELIARFGEAMLGAYETPGRAFGAMCSAINFAAGGDKPKCIAVQIRGDDLMKVPYVRQPAFNPRNEPTNTLIAKYSDPDQLLALPRHVGKKASEVIIP